ncbi:DUF397 domain-containing protein [Streptosporangium sp. NBC_01755]|uniref:DUF397 domain-containing protein n=1 Tax=unclassified Streptosporangium TaxID=2632669 RepID=UPI002DDB31D9|nr:MULTISPECIES: DUF397 domain-containing protein [unclassified Streptosporangium]WSA25546.1 DUF397 domain-containing protein [Streptosporangium sp. NBC_01810]WSD03066.1 DUF397 domain-containing protein [Streptosporangium sp. NBC_01755]
MISPNLSDAEFRKSSYSGTGNDCVEVATNLPGIIAVRDSKDPAGPALAFSPTAWNNFLTGIRSEEI